jgi:hypothetical protein
MGMKEIQNLKRTTDNGQSGQDKENSFPSLTPESCQKDSILAWPTSGHGTQPCRPDNSNSVNPVNPV